MARARTASSRRGRYSVSYSNKFTSAWELAREYLQMEFDENPPMFLARFVRFVNKVHFIFPAESSLHLVKVVIGLAEPDDWERHFLCQVTNHWVMENDYVALLHQKFERDLTEQQFLS